LNINSLDKEFCFLVFIYKMRKVKEEKKIINLPTKANLICLALSIIFVEGMVGRFRKIKN
jgi:hypothetical protein